MFTNHSWTLVMDPTPLCAVVVVGEGIILDTSEMCSAVKTNPKSEQGWVLRPKFPHCLVGE